MKKLITTTFAILSVTLMLQAQKTYTFDAAPNEIKAYAGDLAEDRKSTRLNSSHRT